MQLASLREMNLFGSDAMDTLDCVIFHAALPRERMNSISTLLLYLL